MSATKYLGKVGVKALSPDERLAVAFATNVRGSGPWISDNNLQFLGLSYAVESVKDFLVKGKPTKEGRDVMTSALKKLEAL